MTRSAAIIRQIVAVVAIVLGSLNSLDLPTGVRSALVVAGGLVMATEHVLGSLMDPASSISLTNSSSASQPPKEVAPVVATATPSSSTGSDVTTVPVTSAAVEVAPSSDPTAPSSASASSSGSPGEVVV